MRVATLYDIHGNLPALEAVLKEVRAAGADQVVVGGDVFPGPMSVEALDLLLGLDVPVRFIRGNGDRAILTIADGGESDEVPGRLQDAVQWVAARLAAEHRRVMAGWPATTRITIPPLGEVLFCHATPRNDTEVFTRLTPEARLVPIFGAPGVPLVVCGHPHMQFDRTIGGVRVVNAGSVGMPFGARGAYWLLLGPEIELKRTVYDFAAAADRIHATGYPVAGDFAARNVLQPPTEEETLAVFTPMEIQ